jgi:glycosyltransferase involved in cell wall biosynthesis
MKSSENVPLVSAIIPTCNRPDMLVRAVNSVIQQSYSNVEVIVVDDGSKYDVKWRISKEFGDSCSVIRNTRTPGAAGARNTGFLTSRGEFIGFLDDDDEWMPNKIVKQVEAFQKSDSRVGVVAACSILVENDRRSIRTRSLEGDVFRLLCKKQVAGNTSGPLMRRHVFEEVGLFDESMTAAQDTDLWLRIAKRYHFTTVAEPLSLVHLQGSDRITKNLQKQIHGTYSFLRKHWIDLGFQRKYKLSKKIVRLSFALAQQKLRAGPY